MSEKYNEEAEDLMFELFDEDDFTKVISFVDIYGCDFVDRDGRNLLMNFIIEGKIKFAIELIKFAIELIKFLCLKSEVTDNIR